jgi:hypothetical protein
LLSIRPKHARTIWPTKKVRVGTVHWAARAAGNAAWNAADRALDNWGERNRRALRLGQLASQHAELSRFIAAKQHEYDVWVTRQRDAGNAIPRAVMLTAGWFDGQVAVVRYQMNARQGQMDIFYGGAGGNPLNTPSSNYHGHVVVIDGTVTAWLLPGPQHERERVV